MMSDAESKSYFAAHVHPEARIAPSAAVVGDVTLARDVTVLFGATLRGDYGEHVEVGEGSNVQESACLHVHRGSPCVVGRDVVIGHGAIVHGCTVGDRALIGMGAVILNDAVIGEGAVIGAGALVPERVCVPPRAVMVGVPARQLRTLTDEEAAQNLADARHYVDIGKQLAADGLLRTGAELRAHPLPSVALAAE